MYTNSDFLPWVAFIGAFLICIWPYVQRYFLIWALSNKIPGPSLFQLIRKGWRIPLQRDITDATRMVQKVLHPYIKKYPVIKVNAFLMSLTILCKVESVKTILSNKNQSNKASNYKYFKPVFGDGLVASKTSKWHHRRKLIAPAFYFKILENFLQVMNEQSNTLIHILEEKCQQANGTAFDICPFISRCTLDIICETAMGQGISAQRRHDHEYLHAIDSLWNIVLKRFMKPWYAIDWIYRLSPMGTAERRAENITSRFVNKIIKNKRGELESKNENGLKHRLPDDVIGQKRRLAFLDLLLEKSTEESVNGGQLLTDEDIREEVDTFMFGGHHTSFVNLSWVLYYIGTNPDVQQKIVDELDQIYGGCDRQSTSDDLNRLKYLECVIKETLRLCPSIPVIGRCLSEEANIGGYTIPAGTDVMLSIYWVHRDPAHYTDPESFNPDRFLPENSKDRDPYAFIPFSAGLRSCIGQKFAMMEEKVVLSDILRRFKVTVLKRDQFPNLYLEVMSTPLKGIRIKLEPKSI